MARSMWNGTVGFGLVSVPVKVFKATDKNAVRFNQINRATGNRVRQPKVDVETGKELDTTDLVKGYALPDNKFVVIEPTEIEGLAAHRSKRVELERFVDIDEIDPLLYQDNYYLAPDEGAAKGYKMLTEAMRATGKAGVGKMVMSNKERIAVIRPIADGTLTVSLIAFPEEVRPTDGIRDNDGSLDKVEVSDKELSMAEKLIESLEGEFDHSVYHDEYHEKVLKLIEAKAAGETIEEPEPEAPTVPAPDLMEALEASLAGQPKPTKPKKAAKPRKAASKAKAAA